MSSGSSICFRRASQILVAFFIEPNFLFQFLHPALQLVLLPGPLSAGGRPLGWSSRDCKQGSGALVSPTCSTPGVRCPTGWAASCAVI